MKDWTKELRECKKEMAAFEQGQLIDGYKVYKAIQYNGTIGDMATEWWTDKDYEEHKEVRERMEEEGTLGMPWVATINIRPCPLFDNPKQPPVNNSHRMIFLDYGK